MGNIAECTLYGWRDLLSMPESPAGGCLHAFPCGLTSEQAAVRLYSVQSMFSADADVDGEMD
jgi:hypothetical protein